jgi:hypothetical protein
MIPCSKEGFKGVSFAEYQGSPKELKSIVILLMHVLVIFILIVALIFCRVSSSHYEGFDSIGVTGPIGETGATGATGLFVSTTTLPNSNLLSDKSLDVEPSIASVVGATASSVDGTSIIGVTGATSMNFSTSEPIGYMPPTMQSLFAGQW